MSFFVIVLLLIVGATVAMAIASQVYTRGRGAARREQELAGVSAEKQPGAVEPERDITG